MEQLYAIEYRYRGAGGATVVTSNTGADAQAALDGWLEEREARYPEYPPTPLRIARLSGFPGGNGWQKISKAKPVPKPSIWTVA